MNCKKHKWHISDIKGIQIPITDSLQTHSEIEEFIKPYRVHINKEIDTILAYSTKEYSKKNDRLNTEIGNFIADLIYSEANPIFKKRTGYDIDMVLLNHGGIRSNLPQGNITARHVYQVMPFENSIVVTALKGTEISKMLQYLCKAKIGHPISKLQLTVDKNFNIKEAKIKGQNIESNKTYYVATSDYLFKGGDYMTFFKNNDSLFILDYKIRNAIIDKLKKIDTINSVTDDRFVQKS